MSTKDLTTNLELVIGANETWRVLVKQKGNLFDLSGAKGYFGVKERYESPDYIFRKRTENAGGSSQEFLISDQVLSKGEAFVFAVPADSQDLKAGTILCFDCWFITATGLYLPVVKAKFGRLTIEPTVTRFV